MKFICTAVWLLLFFNDAIAQETEKKDTTLLTPLEIISYRANAKTPVAKTTLTKEVIEKSNVGQDLPFILNQTASVVVNSDAGNGIGYTGIRIRGSDASRINVTLNNIPYNDAESQGTFFVDLPDIASSANSIQIQRGVGTSANGAGAFGGSINVSTNEIEKNKSISVNNSFGSFRSMKNTLNLHSGIFKKHFLFDGRLSNISSDGYVDRATSQLQSFYISGAFIDDNNSIRFNILSGKEKTYQSWYGIDSSKLFKNRTYNSAGTEKAGDPYNNETDNYTQTHYQLFINHQFNKYWKGNITWFLTRGKGYYEQYKADEFFANYGLPNFQDTITTTNLVRQLWLDNIFFGNMYSIRFQKEKTTVDIGAAWNIYNGKHYGKISFLEHPVNMKLDYRYYDLTAKKGDFSGYVKWIQAIHKKWETYLDVQLRTVNYSINGFRNNPGLKINNHYAFLNPKAGITYSHKNLQAYISFAHATKEPNRDDFETGINTQPSPEKLDDWEAGLVWRKKNSTWQINLFHMNYTDQLVLTGKINEVGAYTRTNISTSYRTGIELENNTRFNNYISLSGNISLSENKVKNFKEFLDDYDNGGQIIINYSKTDLAYSPAVVGNVSLTLKPLKKVECIFNTKYVSRQYLDNTSQKNRSLNSFAVQDVSVRYAIRKTDKSHVEAYFNIYNLFSKRYEPNGYTFSYLYNQQQTTENYYFPMAPINFMFGINIKL